MIKLKEHYIFIEKMNHVIERYQFPLLIYETNALDMIKHFSRNKNEKETNPTNLKLVQYKYSFPFHLKYMFAIWKEEHARNELKKVGLDLDHSITA